MNTLETGHANKNVRDVGIGGNSFKVFHPRIEMVHDENDNLLANIGSVFKKCFFIYILIVHGIDLLGTLKCIRLSQVLLLPGSDQISAELNQAVIEALCSETQILAAPI